VAPVTRWRVLGPVEVVVDGRPLDIRRPQQRAVLALLLLDAGRVLPAARIGTALWADAAPGSARTQVQVCVSRIRAVLRAAGLGDALVTEAGGYRLVPRGTVDVEEFTQAVRLAAMASAAGHHGVAAAGLREALALWRGPALTGAAGAFVEATSAALGDRRLAAYEQLADAELALGRHDAVLRVLGPLVDAHPLRERLVGQLMLAMAGGGQQSRALRLFADTRSRLADELGMEPGPDLIQAHLLVLRQQVPAQRVPSPARPHQAPAQLPADVAGFTGREAPLRELDALLPADGSALAATVVISAIGGTAGVGKTALAVHWAHRVAHRFPDGQLHVNLRGFDLEGRSVTTGEALRGFLDALGVPPQRVPADPAHQAGLYRSLLSGRRVLVVLDNARDADQVRPLLPGTPGCLVVVTSRDSLGGLVVAEGARPLVLDLLPADEARDLLAARVGADRAAAEPDAVGRIVRRCARLPLALAIVAARAAAHPGFPLAALADELRDAPFDTLHAGDPATDLRAVFSWSYRTLDDAAARLFRLLGLHPGPDVALPAVASLAGLPASALRAPLAALTRAHLLTERVPGRYAQHDLLRAYAASTAAGVDSPVELATARARLYDHYLHSAHAADLLVDRYRLAQPIRPPEPAAGVVVVEHAGHLGALAWLTAERQVLLAVVAQAASVGDNGHAWRLAATLTTFLDRQGHWHDLGEAQRVALEASGRQGDLAGQAQAHRGLAIVDTWLGDQQGAHAHYERTLDLHARMGDPVGRANTYIGLSWMCARHGRYAEALEHTRQALALFRAVDSAAGQAKALNNIGWLHARIGSHERALECCRQALAVHERNGDRHGAALAWDNLGYVHHGLGDHAEAADCYRRALALHHELGDRYDEADVLANLGDTLHAAGATAGAWTAWHQALAVYDELNLPDADTLRARIAGYSASCLQ
jgi:DNA-binding SARP family transcriptional activator/tetratricopeptide (TPR) repeat protein